MQSDENSQNFQLTVDGETYTLPAGSVYGDLARLVQKNYKDDILLCRANGRLRELPRKIRQSGSVDMLTGTDPDGRRAYRRSVVFLMQKACDTVFPGENPDIEVLYSISEGYFCVPRDGVRVTEELLTKLGDEMRRLVSLDIPIKKTLMRTEDAAALFHAAGMTDKERLMRYRMSSNINIYDLDGCRDYFYGYMVPSTGYLKCFALRKYDDGFVLLFPREDMHETAPFTPSHKLFQVQKNSGIWSERLGIPSVGALNDAVAAGQAKQIILMQEALMEEQIGNLARTIALDPEKKFVMIAGPSSSGKTTFSYRLSIQLRARGLVPHPLSLDDYYLDRDKCPVDPATGEVDLESIACIDTELFNQDMSMLLQGEEILIPTFNFKTQKREYRGRKMKLGPNDVMVIEGIHGLNDAMSEKLPASSKFRIYISALTQLSIDEHNPLSTADGRLVRRIVRDARTRGTSAEETLAMWHSVRRGEEKNIFPYQESADVMFNSALIYEMSVLKLYAVPYLYGITPSSPQYAEAKRLLKLLDYFLPIPPEAVSNTSLIREFIGGSVLDV